MRTLPIAATLALLPTLGVGLLATPAAAATMGSIPVGPGGVSGTVAAGQTQTWSVALERGRVYAVTGNGSCGGSGGATVTLRRAGGAVVARPPEVDGGLCAPAGATFAAPYTGTFTVAVVARSDLGPLDYRLAVVRDCPAGASSHCGIAVGQTLHNLQASYAADQDWFRVRLQAGHTYRIASDDSALELRDGSGRVVASGSPLTFAARATGTYWIAATWGEDWGPGAYSLSLAEATR